MASHLERMQIQGFKSIKSLDLSLRPLNILIGANGSGKSNFVSVFRLLNQIVNEELQLYIARAGGANQLLHFGRKSTSEIVLKLWFGQNGYSCTMVPTSDDSLVFQEEKVYFHDKTRFAQPYSETIGVAHKESNLSQMGRGRGVSSFVLNALQSWRVYHFHDTSDAAKVKQLGDLDDNSYFRPDASNLAAYLYLLRETEDAHYRNIVDTIAMAAPFFKDFVLRQSPLNPGKIRLEWQEKGSDTFFDAHSLSDGTLRFISLATLFLQPNRRLPSTILLDEPELGLHPYAIALLADLMRKVSKSTQVIVATQSVTLVNQFEPEDIIVVNLENDQSVFRHLPAEEINSWVDEYGLGDLWEKNILGGRPSS